MPVDVLERICAFAGFAVALIYTVRLRRTRSVYIADYQAGLRFREGQTCTILPPGSYRSSAASHPITVVDLRPYPFVIERQPFQDVLLANAVISVGGELVVRDPELAITSFKNLIDDPLAIVRENLRPAASRSIADPSVEGRAKLTAAIASELNRELAPRGVEVRNLEITELWAQLMKHSIPAEAN